MYWQNGRCYWQTRALQRVYDLVGTCYGIRYYLHFRCHFLGAAVLSSVALYARQPIIIAYIALGVALGPFGLAVCRYRPGVRCRTCRDHFSLFLLGLDMKPSALWNSLRQSTVVALVSATAFIAVGYSAARLAGFEGADAALIGAALIFSSTIIGISSSTTLLHHRHLETDDRAAVVSGLARDHCACCDGEPWGQNQSLSWQDISRPLLALPLLALMSWASVRLVLLALIKRFDLSRVHFLVVYRVVFGAAELSVWLGLSAEIGAFIAGISIASPIAQYIAISLKPLRDFFLVVFFFSVGSGLDVAALPQVYCPLPLSRAFFLLKPAIYYVLVRGFLMSPNLLGILA